MRENSVSPERLLICPGVKSMMLYLSGPLIFDFFAPSLYKNMHRLFELQIYILDSDTLSNKQIKHFFYNSNSCLVWFLFFEVRSWLVGGIQRTALALECCLWMHIASKATAARPYQSSLLCISLDLLRWLHIATTTLAVVAAEKIVCIWLNADDNFMTISRS